VPIDPDDLLGEAALTAGVAALASRNEHHLAEMTDEERGQALDHYRQLATDVLIAARTTIEADSDVPSAEEIPGRAVVVFEDAGDEDVTVHTAFFPQLEELDENEVRGTRAQIMALMLVGNLEVEIDGEEEDEDNN
jgi:hypothetical protein